MTTWSGLHFWMTWLATSHLLVHQEIPIPALCILTTLLKDKVFSQNNNSRFKQ